MPDPYINARSFPPLLEWPAGLPNPQADGFSYTAPSRAEFVSLLSGPTRLSVVARTAPYEWTFTVWLTPEQHQLFETFYRDAVENHDGEFYARWIGRGRVVAFAQAYELSALGKGYALTGRVIRTRIDYSACIAHTLAVFGDTYRAELGAIDTYRADLAATDTYRDDYPIDLIADNEC